ncbi:hypothetical protein BH10ACT1_BH10ACT1_43260 [soil metagenome]
MNPDGEHSADSVPLDGIGQSCNVVIMKSMTTKQLAAWFAGRIPDDGFTGSVEVTVDREEILVTGRLRAPTVATGDEGEDDAAEVAAAARIDGFREDTRERRIHVARDAEERFGRKVSWAVRCGDTEVAFTTASVPVMTRLRMRERAVLDTLIDAGVARSRSEALAWCVRLVDQHQGEWIDQLREALTAVHQARSAGPDMTA